MNSENDFTDALKHQYVADEVECKEFIFTSLVINSEGMMMCIIKNVYHDKRIILKSQLKWVSVCPSLHFITIDTDIRITVHQNIL